MVDPCGETVPSNLPLLVVPFPKRARRGVCASAQECQSCCVRAESGHRPTLPAQAPTCNSDILAALVVELVRHTQAKRQHVW